MSYLVDTDVVASWLKGRQRDVTLLRELSQEGLAISLITYGEIYEGIYYGRDAQSHITVFGQFLRWVDVLSLNRPIMRRFALVRGQLRQSGQLISDSDIMIAATALHHDLTIVTSNTRHFSRVADLRLYASAE